MQPLVTCVAFCLLTGCALDLRATPTPVDVGWPPDRMSHPGADSGGPEAGRTDAGSVDGGGEDAGACRAEDSRCEREVRITCVGGTEAHADCAAEDAYCAADPSSGRSVCVPRLCTPGGERCTDDLTAVLVCDARGSQETAQPACTFGCDPATSACRTAASCPLSVTDLTPGSTVGFSSCAADALTHVAASECTGSRANGGDRIFRITLVTAGEVYLDLRDDDGVFAIDTILYLRTQCDAAGTQIACSDDLPCSAMDVDCVWGMSLQPRQSRIEMRLPAGTYYVVADSFIHGIFRCGDVRLRFEFR